MSNIRVTYSGLISLGTKFSSIITGLVFTLIVTRSLSPEEFGTWEFNSLCHNYQSHHIVLDNQRNCKRY